MKLERTKNASRNIVFGGMLKMYQILVPFVIRTAMIKFLGMQYVGLNSLFSSVLQVLNLAELGVGSAMVFSMYKPIAEDDDKTIKALMNLYRLYYRVIGFVILGAGLILLPFIKNFVSGSIPEDTNIYVLYLLNLFATVLSYWLFAYKNCLLNAHQRTDVSSKIQIITSTVQYFLQLLVLAFLGNYYLYLIIAILVQIGTNIVTSFIVGKLYPHYHAEGKLEKVQVKNINQKVKDLFTAKLGSIILNSVDSIVISAFLGLVILAKYNNYYYILSSIIGMITVFLSACTAGLGNSFIVETKEYNYKQFNIFTFLMIWIAGFCMCCFLCLYQPFMEIWVGEENLLGFGVVICLCIYYYLYELNQVFNTFKDAAGIWHEDRFRPLVTALVNLGLNLIMVQYIGIYGIIISTVLSMGLIGMPWVLRNIFTTVFSGFKIKTFIIGLLLKSGSVAVISMITYFVTLLFPVSIFYLMCRLAICSILFNVMFILLFRKNADFASAVELLDRATKGLLHLKVILNVKKEEK